MTDKYTFRLSLTTRAGLARVRRLRQVLGEPSTYNDTLWSVLRGAEADLEARCRQHGIDPSTIEAAPRRIKGTAWFHMRTWGPTVD